LQLIRSRADAILAKYAKIKYINKKEFKFSTNFQTKLPKFYGNPKVHKINHPYRPIISQIDGPTSRLNMLVDHILTVTEKQTKFLIKDTTEFLKLIIDMEIPPESLLVSLDVASLYTRIPWEEGIKTVLLKVQEADPNVNMDLLEEAMQYILRNNFCTYKNTIYKQAHGTSMGSRMAVKYANIFMGHKFATTLSQQELKPHFHCRLIDDIFIVWTHGEKALLQFHSNINKIDPNIQYELNYSQTELTFLDTIVKIDSNSRLYTINYIKPTNKQMYLHVRSNHPPHTLKSLPYSQAIRLRRNTTKDEDLQIQINKLNKTFEARGYKLKNIEKSIIKISNKTQRALLTSRKNPGNVRIPLIIPFQPAFVGLDKELKKLWEKYILTRPELSVIFADYPIIRYSKMKSIGEHITSSLYPPKWKI